MCPRIGGSERDRTPYADEPRCLDDDDETRAGGARPAPARAVLRSWPCSREGQLAGLRVESLHGRLPSDEKDG